jgi:dTDP-4-amino-4,6-dideoxygalactose transaminase
MSTATFLPYGRQEISDADEQAVVEALRSPMITQGPRIEAFEQAVAESVGAKHAVAFSSALPRCTARRSPQGSARATRCSRRR